MSDRPGPADPAPEERPAEPRPDTADDRTPEARVEAELSAEPQPEQPQPSGEAAPQAARRPVLLPSGEAASPGTDETLALPPTTLSVEPTDPTPSQQQSIVGVMVPFAAPPTERNGGRLAAKLVLGIGGGAAIVFGVVFALVASLIALSESLLNEIESTAETFIEDVEGERWDEAYGRLCEEAKDDQPVEDYVQEWESWNVADPQQAAAPREDTGGAYVPFELSDGSTVELYIVVEQGQSIETAVCGWTHTG